MHLTALTAFVSCLSGLVAAGPWTAEAPNSTLPENNDVPRAASSPDLLPHQQHVARNAAGWNWKLCETTGAGWCTLYVATGDGSGRLSAEASDYRSVALFDNKCRLLQALMTNSANPKVTLRGKAGPAEYVDVKLDNAVRPRGWISYDGADTPLGDGSGMACNKPEFSDGVQCRKAFECSVIAPPPEAPKEETSPWSKEFPYKYPYQQVMGNRWRK
ncbi:uncharacterized protein PG986_004570 [Apiospora aurea]|uniref:Ecp2 effector protein domain-containing protein n=1 Tax=Apiospora aurea TaxID=335848 RepID=A0ABR1QMY5_9PEZI